MIALALAAALAAAGLAFRAALGWAVATGAMVDQAMRRED